MTGRRPPRPKKRSLAYAGAAVAAAGIGTALWVWWRARQAEREHPPAGRFVQIGDVRLHYVERGCGDPLVLLHGSGSMIQDFATSGLLTLAAGRYRVIAFDRPGYGHSARPRGTIWTHARQ